MITRILILCWLALTFGISSFGQKQDYIWLSGYSGYPRPIYDSFTDLHFATSVMNFNRDPMEITMDSLRMYFDATNASFCNSSGQLLFYTNGCYVANSHHVKVEDSDSINAGYYHTLWDTFGYRIAQGILALPDAKRSDSYVLVHSFYDKESIIAASHHSKILSTYLDMSENNGLGKAANINQGIISDTVGGDLTAARHGNGRDWWMPVLKKGTNCFYKILFDLDGFHVRQGLDCGGPIVSDIYDFGSSAFSPDGNKYAHFTIMTGLTVFDFDRCSGELTNPIYIPSNIRQDSGWIGSGLAFSPNSRFLYASMTKLILQYDLWEFDLANSVDTVGIYDGFKKPFGSYFNTAQIAPDGRIYVSCGNGEAVYHVINNPDKKGDSCNFGQHQISLPSFSAGVPNFPNYRLGKQTGSPCDTLVGLNEIARGDEERRRLKMFPNPAIDYITIDYGFTDWSKSGEVNLEIVNELGQIVYSQSLPHYSGFQKIDISRYSTGMYMVYVKRSSGIIATSKFAKE